MKIRRYTCTNMQEALLKVKMELGSEAVIMNSRKVRKKGILGVFSKPMIEVVAAIDDDYVKPSRPHVQMRTSPVIQENAPPVYNEPVREQPQAEGAFRSERAASLDPKYPYMQVPPPYQQNSPGYARPQHYYDQNGAQVRDERPPQQPQPPEKPSSSIQPGAKEPVADPKIEALENKVKSMESMLEHIYHAVNDKKNPQDAALEAGKEASPTVEPDGIRILRTKLAEYELESKLIDRIIEKVRERSGNDPRPEEALAVAARVMAVLLGEPDVIQMRDDGRPEIVIFVGPTGVGKTTTLAKIAADFTLNRQKKVGLITADTYRIAAVEQLKTYAEILNIPALIVYSPNEIQEAIKKLSDKDLILIDTAGRSHRNKSHFDELKTLVSSAGADEVYLVVSANTGKYAVKEIVEYYSFMKNYKLLFTKLDEAPVPGVIINARYTTGRPLSYTTAGQSVPDDLDVANPKVIVAGLLGTKTSL